MSKQNDSIFRATLRSFFVTAFGTLGVLFGFLFIMIFMGVFGSLQTVTIESQTSKRLLTNAEGTRSPFKRNTPVIIQLDIKGTIGLDKLTSDHIRQALVESREGEFNNDSVKGILLVINTPGGTAIDSQSIYQAILDYKKRYEVPVHAYVEGLCLSGGMYVSAAADQIHATKDSIVGSVGVLIPTMMNFSKILENWEIDTLTITAGKDKDILNPLRPWKKEEAANLQEIINEQYLLFVDAMVTNRPKLSRDLLINTLGANIFTADQGLDIGFVDGLVSGREQALQALVEAAELEDREYQVIGLEPANWVSDFFSAKNPLLKGEINHRHTIPGTLAPELNNQLLHLWLPSQK